MPWAELIFGSSAPPRSPAQTLSFGVGLPTAPPRVALKDSNAAFLSFTLTALARFAAPKNKIWKKRLKTYLTLAHSLSLYNYP
jgi:hypothetical protein